MSPVWVVTLVGLAAIAVMYYVAHRDVKRARDEAMLAAECLGVAAGAMARARELLWQKNNSHALAVLNEAEQRIERIAGKADREP